MVNIGDTRVSFSWENLDNGSVSEAAIKLKARAEVRTLKFFVRLQLFYLTLQEPELSVYWCTGILHPVVEQSRAARLPSVHIPCLSQASALGISSTPFGRLQAEFRTPCDWVGPTHRPSRLVHSKPVGLWSFRTLLTLPFALLLVPSCWFFCSHSRCFYSVPRCLPCWDLFSISFFTKQTC